MEVHSTDLPANRQHFHLPFLLLLHTGPFLFPPFSIWHGSTCVMGVNKGPPQHGSLLTLS